jgi:undecaprenyl diphosphate synthase
MDGNGRWASQRGLKRSEGHKAGAESVRKALKAAMAAEVRVLTLYAFSTENWGRPQDEVQGLFELLSRYLESEADELLRRGVRLSAIGDIEAMPAPVRDGLAAAEATAMNEAITLNLALSYGSRAELARAARLLADEVRRGARTVESITPEAVEQKLWTNLLPDPDLLIRTGGDMRASNFLLWQCAYTELYFTPTLWPDFGEDDFAAALEEYGRRERRYGLCGA